RSGAAWRRRRAGRCWRWWPSWRSLRSADVRLITKLRRSTRSRISHRDGSFLTVLHGRAGEQAEIERLLAEAGAGRSGTLVIRGPAGIGKSALLDHAAERAAGMRVLRGVGVESEATLPFAALHLLLRAGLDRIHTLPAAHATAL